MSIAWHDTIDSTNEELNRLAGRGAPHASVVAAHNQTAGRGRHGRSWTSLPGNLNASFLVRPAPLPRETPRLGFAAALAVAETVGRYLPDTVRPRLKWPNDVLLGGGKIAGILLERSDDWVVIGIGVNLAEKPSDLAYPAAALASFVSPPAPADFLPGLVASLEGWLGRLERDGFEPIFTAWSAFGPVPGEALSVRIGEDIVCGRFAGLGPEGALRLETASGLRTIHSGEVLDPAPLAPEPPKEIGGPPGPEPTRYGDWQYKGRVSDF
ncbi:MAG: biotin--[acetyl-CoA-carboxylase] ligase [Acetobacteraceae bacterium]